jgi:Transposase and inactivated derivatives
MTTKQNRRKFTAEFKAKVALDVLQGKAKASELCKHYDIHPNLICSWKKSLVTNSYRIFEDPHPEKDERDKTIDSLNKEINTLTTDVDFLKKKLGPYL